MHPAEATAAFRINRRRLSVMDVGQISLISPSDPTLMAWGNKLFSGQ